MLKHLNTLEVNKKPMYIQYTSINNILGNHFWAGVNIFFHHKDVQEIKKSKITE